MPSRDEIASAISHMVDHAARLLIRLREQYVDEEDTYVGALIHELTRHEKTIGDVTIRFVAKKFRSKGGKTPPETVLGADFGLVLVTGVKGHRRTRQKAVLVQAKVGREGQSIDGARLTSQAKKMVDVTPHSYVSTMNNDGISAMRAGDYLAGMSPNATTRTIGEVIGRDMYLCRTGDKRKSIIEGILNGSLAREACQLRVTWKGETHHCPECGLLHG